MFKTILNYSTYASIPLVVVGYGETAREADNHVCRQLGELDERFPEWGIDINEACKADWNTFELNGSDWI